MSVEKKNSSASKPRRRFVGSKTGPSKRSSSVITAHQIPADILENEKLNAAIELIPSNYSFEIHKTIHHIRKNGSQMVALQMPEGLQMFACTIADIIQEFTAALTIIMGDVTYGACCVDDFSAAAMGCDMLIHYGHSCLVPMDQTSIKTLYVFVEISIDANHLQQSIRLNFPDDRDAFHRALLESEDAGESVEVGNKIAGPSRLHQLTIEAPATSEGHSETSEVQTAAQSSSTPTKFALVSTIQFVAALQRLRDTLASNFTDQGSLSRVWTGKYDTVIPRSKPLSPGEILGCTAPKIDGDVDALIYLGDGRFHLEAIMIANPTVPAFRYDPYSKKLTRERYDHKEMQNVRHDAIQTAKRSIAAFEHQTKDSPPWGVVLGTLGRQGNFRQLNAITQQLSASSISIPFVPILLSELMPAKLALFDPYISTFVQTSCPRLSIDWGYAFPRPLLSPYECAVAVGQRSWLEADKEDETKESIYPMDFYAAGTQWAQSRNQGTY